MVVKVKINEKRVKYIEIKAWLTFWLVMLSVIVTLISGYALLLRVCENDIIIILPILISSIIALEVVKNIKERRSKNIKLIELELKKINNQEDNMLLWSAAIEFSRLSGLKKPDVFISSAQDGVSCLVDYNKNKDFSVSFLDSSLEKVSFYEIVGVIAHEAAHMLNKSYFRICVCAFCDTFLLITSFLWCVLFLILALTKTASYWIFFYALIFTAINYVFFSYGILFNVFNRKFELACDAYAAKILGTPNPVIKFFEEKKNLVSNRME